MLISSTANAEASLIEADHYQSSIHEQTSWPRDGRSGAKCNPYTFVLRKAHLGLTKKFGHIIPAYHNKIEVEDSCATKTRYGYVSSSIGGKNYMALSGQPVAGEIVGHAYRHLLPLPNSSHMLVSGDYYKTLYKVENVAGTTTKTITLDNQIKYTLAVTNERFDCLDNFKCQLDTIGHTSSAITGNVLAAHIPNFGMASLDIESMSHQSFGKHSVYVRSGAPPYRFVSIAPSGDQAVVYYTGEDELIAYDLTNCQPNEQAGYPDECEQRDLSVYAQEIGFDPSNIERLDFGSDGNLLLFSRNSSDGTSTRYEIASNKGKLTGATSYVAMGDSFASGEGDTNDNWYELGTNVSENKCHLSRRSYPYLLNNEQYFDEFHSVACSGAVTEDVISAVQKDTLNRNNLPSNKLGDWYPGFRPQSEYLKLDNVAVSTISISGNDVAFAGKLQECVLGLGTCKYAEDGPHRALVATEISSIYDTLKRTYSELINTTESNTKIYSVSYPQFVQGSGGTCGLNVHLNDDERYFIGQAVTYMNQVIKAASEEAGVYYLDVEDALEGHNLCSGASDGFMAVNGLTFGDDIKLPGELSLTGPVLASLTRVGIGTESYHPNQKGHQLLRDRINTLTSYDLISHQVCANGEKVCPSEARNVPLPDESYWGEEAVAFATLLNDNPNQELPTTPRSLNMIVRDVQNPSVSGIEKDVSISDLLPGSNVELELQSNPTSLGTFTVDQDGTLETTITLPDDVELGVHTLNAYGTNIIGEEVHYYEHVAVYDQSITTNECFFVQTSGTDSDDDGIDDACDGYYLKQSVGPSVDENEQATATSNHIQDSGVTSENASSTTLDTGFNGLSSNIVSFFPDDTNNTVSINSDRGSVLGDSSQQSLSGLHAIATQDVGNNSWDEWFMIVAVSILLGGTIAIIYRRTH